MKKKEADLINKPLFTGMIKYTLPIIAAYMLTNLFNVADLIVVGRFCGTKAVAAVGATATLITLTVVSFYGFANGTGVIVAFNYGAKNNEKLEKAVHTALPLAVLIGAAVTVFGVLGAGRMLSLMGTPADIIDDSALYLKIYFSGTVLRMVYTFCIAIFRSSGDSKTPLVYLTAGGVRTVAISVPCRYIHAGSSVCDMEDVLAVRALAARVSECFAAADGTDF